MVFTGTLLHNADGLEWSMASDAELGNGQDLGYLALIQSGSCYVASMGDKWDVQHTRLSLPCMHPPGGGRAEEAPFQRMPNPNLRTYGAEKHSLSH